MTVRVVSWNLHGLRDDRAAVLRVLRALRADVVCLQEVPRRPSTPGTRFRLARMASASGLRLVGGGRGAAGNALLVSPRVQVREAVTVRLPSPRWTVRDGEGTRLGRMSLRIGQQRGVVLAMLSVPADLQGDRRDDLVVAAVHLGLDAAERLQHAATVVDLVGRRPGLPAVIAGDLNEPPGGPAWQVLGHAAADPRPHAPPTFPATTPGQRIDAILVSAQVRVMRYGGVGAVGGGADGGAAADGGVAIDAGVEVADLARASDHRPVVADLALASDYPTGVAGLS